MFSSYFRKFFPEPIALRGKQWHAGTLIYTTGGLALLFSWLLWGDFAWQMRDRSVPAILQLLLKRYGASDTLMGTLLGSLPQLLALVLAPIVAFKSDRHRGPRGRRLPYLIIPAPIAAVAILGLASSPSFGAYLHQLGWFSLGANGTILACLAIFWGIFEVSATVANVVFGALLNDVVPTEVIGRFFGAFRILSLVAGIIFAHWIIGSAETHFFAILVGVGLLYGCGITLMCFRVKEGEYPPPPPLGPKRGVRAVAMGAKAYFSECLGIPYYWWFYLFTAFTFTGLIPVAIFTIPFAKSLQMNMQSYGDCLTTTYCISLVLSYPLGMLADRFHPLRVTLIILALYALVTFIGGCWIHDTFSFSVILIAQGVVSGSWMTSILSVGNRLLPREEFAQFGSIGNILTSLFGIAAAPLAGYALDHLHHDYRYTYFMTSGLTASAVVCGLVLHRGFVRLGGTESYVAPRPAVRFDPSGPREADSLPPLTVS